jgi:hypothetical protein
MRTLATLGLEELLVALDEARGQRELGLTRKESQPPSRWPALLMSGQATWHSDNDPQTRRPPLAPLDADGVSCLVRCDDLPPAAILSIKRDDCGGIHSSGLSLCCAWR